MAAPTMPSIWQRLFVCASLLRVSCAFSMARNALHGHVKRDIGEMQSVGELMYDLLRDGKDPNKADAAEYLRKQEGNQPGDYGPGKARETQKRLGWLVKKLKKRGAPGFRRPLPTNSNCSLGVAANPVSLLADTKNLHVEQLERRLANVKAVEGSAIEAVNAGMGTTATRALHNMICSMGVPALHYSKHCWVSKDTLLLQANILGLYDNLKRCASKEFPREDPRCKTETHLEDLIGNVTAIVSSGVTVLSDVPYTNLVPLLQRLVPDIHVIQTLREPTSWAAKRVAHNAADAVCADVAGTAAVTHFDMTGCLVGKDWIGDAFEPQGQTVDKNNETHYELLGDMYAQHNAVISRSAGDDALRQLCAWDSEPKFDDQLDSTAAYLTHGVPPKVQELVGNNAAAVAAKKDKESLE